MSADIPFLAANRHSRACKKGAGRVSCPMQGTGHSPGPSPRPDVGSVSRTDRPDPHFSQTTRRPFCLDKGDSPMRHVDAATMDQLRHDFDAREVLLRAVVTDRLAENPPPERARPRRGHLLLRLPHDDARARPSPRSATTPPAASSTRPRARSSKQCSARQAGVDPFDATGKIGLLHVAFPLKMMLQPDGHLTSCDLLHTVAGAVIFDFYENQDARLIALKIPDEVLATFPGPAYGPLGVRTQTGFAADQPAFGTILKPTAGITPDDVERLVAEVAGSPLLMFIKEDEDLYPNLDYSPVAERTRRAVAAIERVQGPARRPRPDLRPARQRRPARDPRHGPRRPRRRRDRRHVQRDLRRRDRPDGPRGDEAPAEPAGHLRPQRRDRRQDAVDLARGRSTSSPGSTGSTSARPPPSAPARRSSAPTATSGSPPRTP